MRSMSSLIGLLLIVLGIFALMIRTITFFTTDQVVGPLGFLVWDVERPHMIFISPLAGLIAIGVGFVLLTLDRRKRLA